MLIVWSALSLPVMIHILKAMNHQVVKSTDQHPQPLNITHWFWIWNGLGLLHGNTHVLDVLLLVEEGGGAGTAMAHDCRDLDQGDALVQKIRGQ